MSYQGGCRDSQLECYGAWQWILPCPTLTWNVMAMVSITMAGWTFKVNGRLILFFIKIMLLSICSLLSITGHSRRPIHHNNKAESYRSTTLARGTLELCCQQKLRSPIISGVGGQPRVFKFLYGLIVFTKYKLIPLACPKHSMKNEGNHNFYLIFKMLTRN